MNVVLAVRFILVVSCQGLRTAYCLSFVFKISKIEEFILYNRTANCESDDVLNLMVSLYGCASNLVTLQIFVGEVGIYASAVLVCTALCDSVYLRASKSALANIERHKLYANLVDGIEGDRCAVSRKVSVKSEHIVEACAVDSYVRLTVVTTTYR